MVQATAEEESPGKAGMVTFNVGSAGGLLEQIRQEVLSTLNHGCDILNNEYKEALHRKSREPNLAMKLFTAGAPVLKTGTEVAAALNNVDISAEYVIKLRHEIEEQCVEELSIPSEKEKVKSCLVDLGETSNALRQLGQVYQFTVQYLNHTNLSLLASSESSSLVSDPATLVVRSCVFDSPYSFYLESHNLS